MTVRDLRGRAAHMRTRRPAGPATLRRQTFQTEEYTQLWGVHVYPHT